MLIRQEMNLLFFLAGPTPRTKNVDSWRPKAISILKDLNYKGSVLVPECENWIDGFDYCNQIEWELMGLNSCTHICFWIPRELDHMPAFTTNVEFGMWVASTPIKVHYGRPKNAPKMTYLDYLYQNFVGRIPFDNLGELLKSIVDE